MGRAPVVAGEILDRATSGSVEDVAALFSGFLTEAEEIRGCGYLGSLGFVFTEHSFWCVTNMRACSLRIKRGGEVTFSSGYGWHINSEAFYQPSLVLLWVLIAIVVVSTIGFGILLIPWMVAGFYRVKKSGVVFWVREGIPVYIFADRSNLSTAQRVSTLIAELVSSNRGV